MTALRFIAELEPTPCQTCDYVHPDTRNKPPYAWRCQKFPVLPGMNPVAPDYRPEPPYAKCESINHGWCPLWTPRRQPEQVTE